MLFIYSSKNIIFFDGECGLCDRTIQWLLPRTPPHILFAPLQGETAHKCGLSQDLTTVIYWRQGGIHTQSEAALWILKDMGGAYYGIALALKIVPLAVRNFIYSWIAKNRRKIWADRCTWQQQVSSERFLR